MLLRQVLLELPDRPGSLGQVTTLLGRLGVDIRQMRVRGRDGRIATDEFTVAVPGPVIERTLSSLLEEVEGVTVLSMWAIDVIDETTWSPVRAPAAN
jgi:hypothetical protein